MAHRNAAWGIEIGANAIKAIRLERDGDQVSVADFAVIPHKKVLTTPDLDQDEMIRLTLGQFISQKPLEGEHLVMSVPGHSAFARFAKLPPVEPKKVPDIVKFEAVQQIPFPIEQVEWDYQTFHDPDSPEVEVGIFAITREKVQHMLSVYGELGVSPESLTLSPVAVYNAVSYDHAQSKHKGPVLYLDIGTTATDVIVAEEGRVWIRTFPLGGTHFTEAIASAFKLTYSKAEKLKQEAATSKYAKQIMQAMRPVFTDLLQDLQRSIGYYQSLHREAELKLMVGLGSTFKIPGLRKFLGQQLQIDVQRLDEYRRIAVTGREAASFAENAVNMATAYGLALQGVGLARIDVNLVPVITLRQQVWHAKTKWFGAAAAIMILGSGALLIRPMLDRASMAQSPPPVVTTTLNSGESLKQRFEAAQTDVGYTAQNMLQLLDYRDIWPHLLNDAAAALASASPQPELLAPDIEAILKIRPEYRRLIELRELRGQYNPPQSGSNTRRIAVTMDIKFSHRDPLAFLNGSVAKWLRDHVEPSGDRASVPYRIVENSINLNPSQIAERVIGKDGTALASASTTSSPTAPTKFTGAGGGFGGSGAGRPAGGGGFGDLSAAGGGAAGRADPSAGGGMAAPGSGISAGAVSGSGGRVTTPPPPTSSSGSTTRPGSTGQGDHGSEDGLERLRELNEIAPVKPPPSEYPSESLIYYATITFEVELIDKTPSPEGTNMDEQSMTMGSLSSEVSS